MPVSVCLRNDLEAYDSYTPVVQWTAEHGKEIAALRNSVGWTLDDLADASGVDRGTLNRIERAKQRPQRSTLQSIRAALNAEVTRKASRPGKGSGRVSEISGKGGQSRIEDRLADLLTYIKTLDGKRRTDFIKAVTALLAAIEHARPAASSGTTSDDGR